MASNIVEAKPVAGLTEQPVPLTDYLGGNEKSEKIYTNVEERSASGHSDKDENLSDQDPQDDNAIIVTGADAALHLLPMRDDGDASLTFRSIVLSTGLAAFQSVMYQIYMVCCSWWTIPFFELFD